MLQLFSVFLKRYRDIIVRRFQKEMIKPYMKHKEIAIIEDILKNLQPTKCLEWGCGYSTLFFPRFLRKNSEWVSIEHDKKWYIKIKSLNRNPNVKIFYIPPNNFPWTDEYGDGSYTDLRDYIQFPSGFGKFDFILIDGRARKDGIIKAHKLLTHDGVVVLHDANRRYYHESFGLFKNQVLFKDYRKWEGGLWIGSKERHLNTILDLNKTQNFWWQCTRFEKLVERAKIMIQCN